jgi:multiple sugar transport system ATP-binding protein
VAELSIVRINAEYDGQQVLHDVSLDVASGELLTLVGPSGCGKSTLLRVVAGLLRPASGSVWIGGEDITRLEPHRRDIAMVFQDNALQPHRTVEESIGFPLRVRGIDRGERKRRVAAEAKVFGLTEFLERAPRELSAGHQQAAQTAKSMVRAPRLFLMDEPLARLDSAQRAALRRQIALVQRGYEVTMVYVTNDRDEAMALGDRMAVMQSGRLLQVDAPRRVFDRPADRFVAEFIAEMNLIDAVAGPRAGGFEIRAGGTAMQAWNPQLAGCDRVTVGVTPGHVVLGKEPADGIALDGTVRSIERLGPNVRLYVDTMAGRITASLPEFGGNVGDPVRIGWEARHIHAFDVRTGEALFHPA